MGIVSLDQGSKIKGLSSARHMEITEVLVPKNTKIHENIRSFFSPGQAFHKSMVNHHVKKIKNSNFTKMTNLVSKTFDLVRL